MRRMILAMVAVAFYLPTAELQAQHNLPNLPGYDNYEWLGQNQSELFDLGIIEDTQWSSDGSSLYYTRGDQHYRVSLRDYTISEIDESARPPRPETPRRRGRGAGRALQLTEEPSPDGRWTSNYRDYNVVLVNNETQEEKWVTKLGVERFRYGTACWVYGEELSQGTAMWWSPDSRKLAFYEIDERHCRDFYLTIDQTEVYPDLYVERYPKAGELNPIAGLLIYDLETGTTTRVDVGGNLDQYVYDIEFSPDGSELIYHRTNRHQNFLEVVAADVETGQARLIVSERQETWQENSPRMDFLADGERFIWQTERNGYTHYELRHIDGRLLNPITKVGPYQVQSLLDVDEQSGYVYYLANDGEYPLNAYLHRVRLDGRNDVRLTSRDQNIRSVVVSPDDRFFIAIFESMEDAPTTVLFDDRGRERAVLAESDLSPARAAGWVEPEMFTFKAADGETDLYGRLLKPLNFDPSKSYPLLLSIYAGPGSNDCPNRFTPTNSICEFGFVIAQLNARGSSGRGKAFLGEGYQKLGIVEISDHAKGVQYLSERPYIDGNRVGIYGHSYGGYMSALAILKYPDVFHVAVAGAPVTDWKNYDTIYTERYMRTPQENPDGYRDGSCLTYADQLKGKLLILHGLVDDNVHPNNTWQLIQALQEAEKDFDLMIYPQSKHGLIRSATSLRWEYLIENLNPVPEPGRR